MGYRSEVVLAVSKEMKPHFLAVLAQHESVRSLVHDADTFEKDYADGGLLMYWSDIKWYDTFPEIAAMEKFICECESECLKSWDEQLGEDKRDHENGEWNHFRFIRIGEEWTDIEAKGHFADDVICVQRAVDF